MVLETYSKCLYFQGKFFFKMLASGLKADCFFVIIKILDNGKKVTFFVYVNDLTRFSLPSRKMYSGMLPAMVMVNEPGTVKVRFKGDHNIEKAVELLVKE